MKYALKESIFEHNLLAEASTIDYILGRIQKGYKIELLFNVLLYANFSKWNVKHNRALIQSIKSIVHESDETNLILLTQNTLLALAHCCEFLTIIGTNIKLLRRKSKQIIERLELLTEKLVDLIDNDKIENYYLDRDFKDRTLLKIVTIYGLNAFLRSQKTTSLLDSIWQGMRSTEGDGRLSDFSMMTYLFGNRTHYIKGK